MASNKPVIRQIAWISMIPQLIVMAILVVLFGILIKPFEYALIVAMLFYLFVSNLLRNLVPRHHRKGIALYKAGNYAQAIGEYEKSYAFFTEHAWIDKYRFIVLLSSSRISYTEMALLNIAFCYAQMGDGNRAKEYYEKVLEQFPDSEMAKSALRMLMSGV
ncbi:MAG: tetratricopeptide repeat protein [Bacillota bacterium]|nr:tetratricopeptide repeat protein [Bacillota bacterium]